MDNKESRRVSAILPAYNEETRIGKVLEVITSYKNFKEIIVVDDGSTDNTSKVIEKYNVNYIKNEKNMGKGYSMNKAVEMSSGDIIFFCDADVNGLTHEMIDEIINPVLEGNVEMMIGMRNRKLYYLKFVLAFVPFFGGKED